MSRYIATRAIRGANALVMEAEVMLDKALADKGPDAPVAFPNTAYYLPVIYAMTATEAATLGDLRPALAHARELLHPVPAGKHWTPYLGETLDSGMATLLAAEVIEAIRFVYNLQPEPFPGFELAGGTHYSGNGNGLAGHLNGPIDDVQLRTWGIKLVDGRMPGFAAIVGCAKSNEVAVQIVKELQQRNILIFLSGNVNGRSIIHQLQEEGVTLGYDTYTVPFGTDTLSAVYALGVAARSALTFGGLKAGQARDILLYNRERVFAFVLALGEVDDLKYAAAAGAINFGFPVIADTVIPEILPTGVTTYEHVVSLPWNEIEGKDDLEKAERLVQKCIEVRGVKIKMANVPVPVPYGSAFEGEVVRKADMRVEFGGKYSRCFEYLHMVPLGAISDGVVEVVGPEFSEIADQGAMDMGIVVEVAGRKMQEDFEPVLERQIHYFVNGASGIQHIGQRDIAWIRIAKSATEKGFNLKHFGAILHARLHADFGAIVDKVKVTIYTKPDEFAKHLDNARDAYDHRNKRLANLTDDAVDEFFSCTLCQSFAPNHVCIVSPERLGLCGAYNWLDCKASYNINPTGPNQPIKLGKMLDPVKGYWSGTLDYAKVGSHGVIQDVSMYSIMENPMTACLTADTEVLVNGKLVDLGDFVEAQPERMEEDQRLMTLDGQGKLVASKLLGVHKNPAPPHLIRIQTKSGQRLTLTPNHEVAVDRWEQNGHGPWARADALQPGDQVYTVKHNIDSTQTRVLSHAAGRVLAELPESYTVLGASTLFHYKTGRSRPTTDQMRAVIEEAPETKTILAPYLESDFFLDTITSVETIESAGRYEHVYNLSLLDINSYIANGIHVKNCGCFECIVMVIPEVNGVMVLSREDTGMTPAGMKFSTLAGMAGGGVQTPGVMGVGKFYLVSPKFISADGGFKRVVWMSSVLKETMAAELQAVAEREGDPGLVDRIATGNDLSDVDDLIQWLEEKQHPVLKMGPIGAAGEEDVVAQAEAVAEKAVAKAEPVAAPAPPPAPTPKPAAPPPPKMEAPKPVAPPPPPAPQAVQPPSPPPAVSTVSEDRVERAVNSLRRALVAALAELGGLDEATIQALQGGVGLPAIPAAPAAPMAPPLPPEPAPVAAAAAVEPEKMVEPAPDAEWLPAGVQTEIAVEKWSGKVKEIALGAAAAEGGSRGAVVKIGGQTAMPFMFMDGELPNAPVIAVEIADRRPDGWSELLYQAWGDVLDDPAAWAKAAAAAGANVLYMRLSLTDAEGQPNTPAKAVAAVRAVLQATGLPLIVVGPGQAEADNDLLVPISEAFKGERLALGICEDKNYRTIVATAMANGHLVIARTAMDVNLAKQLNILISDMGLPLDRILMDPTTGALGYGFEYGYSVMERLRQAALQGDAMTQLPMIVNPGEEAWKTKEAKVGEGVPAAWGDWSERSITWETLTSTMLIESGADIVVLRHPETVKRTRVAIDDLMNQ